MKALTEAIDAMQFRIDYIEGSHPPGEKAEWVKEQKEHIKELKDRLESLIQPSDINTSKPFYGSFNKSEAEDQANVIVRFCQRKRGWVKFRLSDIRYSFIENELLNYLTVADGVLSVTPKFIAACYKASPKKHK